MGYLTLLSMNLVLCVQERLRHEEDLERNNGVWWQERLMAVPLEANVVEQLGIKRSTDKVYAINCCTQKRLDLICYIVNTYLLHAIANMIASHKPLLWSDGPSHKIMCISHVLHGHVQQCHYVCAYMYDQSMTYADMAGCLLLSIGLFTHNRQSWQQA